MQYISLDCYEYFPGNQPRGVLYIGGEKYCIDRLQSYTRDNNDEEWQPSYWEVFIFDDEYRAVEHYRSFDEMPSDWDNYISSTYSYNYHGKLTEEIGYVSTFNNTMAEHHRIVFEYDQYNNLISETYQEGSSTNWHNIEKKEYYYNDRRLLKSFDYQTWVSEKWIDSTMRKYRSKYEYFDNDSIKKEIEFERVSFSSTWGIDRIYEYEYSENIKIKTISNVSNENSDTVMRYITTYNSNGYISNVLEERYKDGFWETDDEAIYEYDNTQRLLSMNYNNYNRETQEFYNNFKLLFEYNDNESIITSNMYYWKDEIWHNTQKTYYYYTRIPTSIDDVSTNVSKFDIFPNPASDKIYLNYTIQNNASTNISLYNSLGIKIMDFKPNNLNSNLEIDISNLPSGIYFINLRTGSETITKQFVKIQ